ncbi:hypothetical protein C8T65DRAFT_712118 [Cerioporus squamosus]|nr:hypothetical protein C8T65DRAFT_712118 [Cerioporus squamosus]
MEDVRGQGRGSYIWGRSVHNTRIERLWYDVTSGFGQKWNNFFYDLEMHCHLNPDICYEDGLRGLVPHPVPDEAVDDISQYGIDWEANNNPAIMDHLLANNPQEWDDTNPFRPSSHTGPSQFSYVQCEAPGCPFYLSELQELYARLAAEVDLQSKNMTMRRMVWEVAFKICEEILDRPGRIGRV